MNLFLRFQSAFELSLVIAVSIRTHRKLQSEINHYGIQGLRDSFRAVLDQSSFLFERESRKTRNFDENVSGVKRRLLLFLLDIKSVFFSAEIILPVLLPIIIGGIVRPPIRPPTLPEVRPPTIPEVRPPSVTVVWPLSKSKSSSTQKKSTGFSQSSSFSKPSGASASSSNGFAATKTSSNQNLFKVFKNLGSTF